MFESFKGQLEKGLKSNRPHYNLCVKISSKVLSSTVVRELSLALYNVKNCYSINVEPAHDIKSLEKYCLKDETRLILPGTIYYPPSVDIRISEFFEALEEDEELKKVHESPRLYQEVIFSLIRSKPGRREVNFIFNPKGGVGKSLTADYISLNPEFNALLAPQLSSPDRWVSGLINQLEEYVLLNNHFPTTILIDMTRNEDNLNVENLYSTLENIKNGRLDSTFYGRFKPFKI